MVTRFFFFFFSKKILCIRTHVVDARFGDDACLDKVGQVGAEIGCV